MWTTAPDLAMCPIPCSAAARVQEHCRSATLIGRHCHSPNETRR
ncbi:hypothetical protein TIFTF001_002880 [Ficus carica]|uniref:Uncharacterized protein n=1 Tax=Ficus carica TaxID=3494 RepID=A0AA87ZDN4_FICCA|nr:hypothetical protein TIFTF001_002880 [Ficus carica]